MRYNTRMEKINVAIIGGGAAGLFLANLLSEQENTADFLLFEQGERLGKKLSATGNGQGNITNLAVTEGGYFSFEKTGEDRANAIVKAYDDRALAAFFQKRGILLSADERGRVYPASRQASALTDALRYPLENKPSKLRLSTRIKAVEKTTGGFILTVEKSAQQQKIFAKNVVFCCGGKAAKNFGTDGSAYALATGLGHTLTPTYPSLVQLKTDVSHIKTLKGIRVGGASVSTNVSSIEIKGDVIFTEYGVSGDAIFRLSAYVADKIQKGNVQIYIDFLPGVSIDDISSALQQKSVFYPDLPIVERLFGVVNNQLGRAVFKRAQGDEQKALQLIKKFPLTVTGSLGFDYAQVTKGGIRVSETDDNLQSRLYEGAYFAGEVLDIDGACGGYNLQWAFSSACAVARALQFTK